MRYGFIRVMAAAPPVTVADPAANANAIVSAAKEAASAGAELLVTPELSLTACSCGDLFLQEALLCGALAALERVCAATAALPLVLAAGLPLAHRGNVYNCAAFIYGGRVMGLVPKVFPACRGQRADIRQFAPAPAGIERCEEGFLRGVPIGASLLFRCENMPAFTIGAQIGGDGEAPIPPAALHCAAGATVIAAPYAEGETAGGAQARRAAAAAQCARLACAYVCAGAGAGESTTDLVFSGHCLVAEDGRVAGEGAPFGGRAALCDIDTAAILHERRRRGLFCGAAGDGAAVVLFSLPERAHTPLAPACKTPFVPQGGAELAAHCEETLDIQAAGLQKRLSHAGARAAVIGVSGGLDSALALLAAVRAQGGVYRGEPRIIAVTMPCFGTTPRTLENAQGLCAALGVELQSIDITATVNSHFADIRHGGQDRGTVYENAQARIRTLTLMDIANGHGGLVVGTGSLSELALGFTTYNGDHMSMYSVNAAVPKTLLRSLVEHIADVEPKLRPVLSDILGTPVSPELLPPSGREPGQRTEELVGPYELHDFFLYHMLRRGAPPAKILHLALHAFAQSYSRETLVQNLRVFYSRFFAQQFKRSCLPDGPAAGEVSLSPRGGWQMPSDACARLWLAELENIPLECDV